VINNKIDKTILVCLMPTPINFQAIWCIVNPNLHRQVMRLRLQQLA